MMNIHGIEEVSQMLAEFDFSGIKGEIQIVFSPIVRYGNFDEEWLTAYLYDDDSNPENWDKESWTKWIIKQVESYAALFKEYGFLDVLEGFSIDEVIISYYAAKGYDWHGNGFICEATYDANEKCWTTVETSYEKSYVEDPIDIDLRRFDIQSSDDVMSIVCQLTDIEPHDFCVA